MPRVTSNRPGTTVTPIRAVQITVANVTVRLALSYVLERLGHRPTVHQGDDVLRVADLRCLPPGDRPVDVLVVEPLPLHCREAVDRIVRGGALAAITSDRPETLGSALHAAADGTILLPSRVIELANSLPRLPERLDATLRLVVAGHTNARIARHLHRSESTVKRDISELLRSFHAPNRQSLAGVAAAAGYNGRPT